jgi:AcrR family transcriptional regulator
MSYDYKQTHENILKSAMVQFREKGFRDASVRKICTDAGVTNGAFYAHFESKEDLFNSLVRPVLDKWSDMYSSEKKVFLKIKSSEDIIRAFEETFDSSKALIGFVCKNRDVFLLITDSSVGTGYENFIDTLIEEEAKSMISFLKLSRKYVKNPDVISENIIKIGSSFLIKTVFEGLRSGKSAEDISKETKLVSDYCIAGYRHLLGI